MATTEITDLTSYSNPDAAVDVIPIVDVANNITKKITRNSYLGLASAPVGLTDSQAVTNKTIGNTNTVTLKDTLFTLQDDADATKQARFQLSGITTATTRTYTLPNASSTLVDLSSSQTLSSKTLTAPVINNGSITGTTITTDAIVGQSAATSGTVYGLSVSSAKINGTSITDASIATAQLANGSVTNAKLSTTAGEIGGAWTTVTPTQTGWSATTTLTGRYTRIGKLYIFTFDVVGTSNATSATLTLPATAANTANIFFGAALEFTQDNGSTLTAPGKSFINTGGATTLSLFKDISGGGWTGSGTKGARGTVIYEAA